MAPKPVPTVRATTPSIRQNRHSSSVERSSPSGRGSVKAPSLLVVASTGGKVRIEGQHRSTVPLDGAALGPLTKPESQRLLVTLAAADDPDTDVRDLPWAAAAVRPSGEVLATCSTMFLAGLFYFVDKQARRLVIATDPLTCQRESRRRPDADQSFLHAFALAAAPHDQTPYRHVRRLPPGVTLRWSPRTGEVHLTDWGGPEALPAPHLDDHHEVVTEYLARFDAITARLAARTEKIVATVSGGLDSTFLAASLVRTAPAGAVIEGFCHTPVVQALVSPRGKFDPDDLQRAEQLAAWYPGRLTIQPLRNDDLVHPLDAARRSYGLSGWPVFAPTNSPWIQQFTDEAAAAGVTLRFHAGFGNASYSYDHPYAAAYYLRGGRLPTVLSLSAGRDRGTPALHGLRRRVVTPLARSMRAAQEGVAPFTAAAMTPPLQRTSARQEYVHWLAGRRGPYYSAFAPAATAPALVADPFAARSMLELAAAIEPRVWQRGHDSRSLARRLAAGRVPDEIRLRRRRGGQGMDTWFVVRSQAARMERGVEAVADSSLMRAWVGVDELTRWWRAVRESPTTDPPERARLHQLLRLAGIAEYLDEVFGS